MTGTLRLAPLVRKEARALTPIWLASLATVAASTIASTPELQLMGILGYMLGATTLGALAIGHEYSYRTLGPLLTQPVDRVRILHIKAGVLVVMLVALAGGAVLMFGRIDARGVESARVVAGPEWAWTIVLLSLLCGLSVAPWLTMQFRNPIAGVVFTLTIPASLWLIQSAVEGARHGWNLTQPREDVGLTVVWTGVLAASAAALVFGRRKFMELEAIDGHADLWLPRVEPAPIASARKRARRGRPLVRLVRKELRLQSVSFLVALLFVLTRIAMSFSGVPPDLKESIGGGVTVLYVLLVTILVGATASAEERTFGTIGWQILQPVAFRKQWMIKVATAVVLGMMLALVLPFAVHHIEPVLGFESVTRLRMGMLGSLRFIPGVSTPVFVVLLCVCAGLYVSSLCTGGLRALLLAFPFVTIISAGFERLFLATNALFNRILDIESMTRALFERKIWGTVNDWWWQRQTAFWVPIALASGFVLLLLVFAARNHRSAEHGWTLARRQIGWIAVYVATAGVALGAIPLLVYWMLASDLLGRSG